MRTLSLLLCVFFLAVANAQVGINTTTPDAAAALDINAEMTPGTYGGLKLPTMTVAQRASITAVPDGMMIYLSDGTTRCLQMYDATQSVWQNVYCMNSVPVANSLTITGTPEVSETLTLAYTYTDTDNDAEAGTSIQWYRSTTNGGALTAIAGASTNTYTLTNADSGLYLVAGVTPAAATGLSPGAEAFSNYVGPVQDAPTVISFDPQMQIISEDAMPTDVALTFSFPNVSSTPVTVRVEADNYSRLTQTTFVDVVIPANQTSPYTTNVFNVQDDALTNGTALITFTITNVSGGAGINSIGATSTDTVTITDDEFVFANLIHDFETTLATPTLPLLSAVGGAYQTGTGTAPASPNYLDARSYGVSNGTATLTFGPVDGSSITSLSTRLRLASFSGTGGNGADAADNVEVQISVDGGTTWSTELEITGFSNARYDFTAADTASVVYDGNNVPSTFSLNGMDISFLEVTGIPNASDMRVRVVLLNNSGSELWVIDNVEVIGN